MIKPNTGVAFRLHAQKDIDAGVCVCMIWHQKDLSAYIIIKRSGYGEGRPSYLSCESGVAHHF